MTTLLGPLLEPLLPGQMIPFKGDHVPDMADAQLLLSAGPGHFVLSLRWAERDGSIRHEARVFENGASKDVTDAWRRASGWPGHSGGWWNYFKADVRRWISSRFNR